MLSKLPLKEIESNVAATTNKSGNVINVVHADGAISQLDFGAAVSNNLATVQRTLDNWETWLNRAIAVPNVLITPSTVHSDQPGTIAVTGAPKSKSIHIRASVRGQAPVNWATVVSDANGNFSTTWGYTPALVGEIAFLVTFLEGTRQEVTVTRIVNVINYEPVINLPSSAQAGAVVNWTITGGKPNTAWSYTWSVAGNTGPFTAGSGVFNSSGNATGAAITYTATQIGTAQYLFAFADGVSKTAQVVVGSNIAVVYPSSGVPGVAFNWSVSGGLPNSQFTIDGNLGLAGGPFTLNEQGGYSGSSTPNGPGTGSVTFRFVGGITVAKTIISTSSVSVSYPATIQVGTAFNYTVSNGVAGSQFTIDATALGLSQGPFTLDGSGNYTGTAQSNSAGDAAVTFYFVGGISVVKSVHSNPPAISSVAYDAAGTYYLTIPAGVTVASVYLKGGDGGGGGGGGAGEYNWTPSASGGGAGQGGKGQYKSQIVSVTPGSVLKIIVGAAGAPGAGGIGGFGNSMYSGYNGVNGGSGAQSIIEGIVAADAGAGGSAGAGAPGDSPYALVPGGASGGGYPSGSAGRYAHIAGAYEAGQYGPANTTAGEGGASGSAGGSGGSGGNWGPTTAFEYYPPDRLGKDGGGGTGGFVHIDLASSSLIVPSNFAGYSGPQGSPIPPYDNSVYVPPNNDGVCCFPAGSRVLMADSTWKAIETLELTDMVMGMNGPESLVKIDTPVLGSRRMLRFEDSSLTWSEEHALWTRRGKHQWWWSANPRLWKAEADAGLIGGLFDNSTLRSGVANTQWANLNGWLTNSIVVDRSFDANTKLYLPITNGSPIIVEGYAVGAGVNEAGFDYATLDWDAVRANIKVRL